MFAQLGQYAPCGFWMEESDVQALRSFARMCVDEPHAFGFHLAQRFFYALRSKSDVVDAFSSFFNEFGDGAFFAGRL